MRRFTFVLTSVLILALLAACVSSDSPDDDVDDTSDQAAAAEPSPAADEPDPTATPGVDSQPTAEPDPIETPEPEATPDATPTGESVEHIVEIQDPHDFDPDELVIGLGDTITFINTGRINHTASLDPEIVRDPDNAILPAGAEPWDSGDLEPGDEYSIRLVIPGDYVYFCRPHEVLGQIGSITVLEEGESVPAPTDDAAPEDDDSDDDEIDDYL